MIVSGGADRYAAAAAPTTTTTTGNTTMMVANLQQQQQLQNQQQQQLQQPQQPEDFWWWPTQSVDGNGLAQHQQISSSSSLQQQQHQLQQQLASGSGDDEFDSFDLSLLINNVTDGYFNDNRLSTAAISATVTVRTNAIDDSNYYAPTTTSGTVTSAEVTTPTQQQMDLQQLLSLCDDLCFFGPTTGNSQATENDVKPTSIFDQEQRQAAAIVTTTTACNTGRQSKMVTGPATIATVPSTPTPTVATKDVGGDSTSNTTLLRSLLTATVPSLPAVTVTHTRDSAIKVESTTEVVSTISTTKTTTDTNNKVSTASDDDKKINNNKHRILIEMLRGEINNNDVAVVPTRPTRRRPRSAAFGADSDQGSNDDDDRGEPSYGGRRRLNGPSSLVDDGPDVQRMDMDDDGLIMYGSPYYSTSTSPLWLDHMAAAAAAETTGAGPTDFYPCAATADNQQENLNRSHDHRHVMADDDIDNIVDDCCASSDYCNDYGSIGSGGVFDPDGGYYSVAATEVAYSPSTATEVEFSPPTVTQVQSVMSPLPSCGNSSTTTTTVNILLLHL